MISIQDCRINNVFRAIHEAKHIAASQSITTNITIRINSISIRD